jgi:hypothetical protein
LRIKPASNHLASSYSSDKPFSPTFTPTAFSPNGVTVQNDHNNEFGCVQSQVQGSNYMYEPMGMGSTEQGYGLQIEPEDYQQQHHQPQQHHLQQQLLQPQQLQQLHYQQQQGLSTGRDLEMMPSITSAPGLDTDFTISTEVEHGQESLEEDESKSKRSWFGKKKKKDTIPAPPDKLDNVAKIMDEALFGGSSSSSSRTKSKDKGKEVVKDVEHQEEPLQMLDVEESMPIAPTITPFIAPRKDSLVEYEGRLSYTGGRGPSLETGHREDHHHTFYVAEKTHPPALSNHVPESGSLQPNAIDPFSAPALMHMAKTITPVPYAPRTTYIPSPKKPLVQNEEEVLTPVLLPISFVDSHPESPRLQGSDSLLSEPLVSPTVDSPKKSKNRPFNLFKNKKSSSSKLSLEQEPATPMSPTFNTIADDMRSMHSDKKSSVHSNDRRTTVDAPPVSTKDSKKKRESDEYVPYEYQEELEGPLMERVEVPENREVIGFVMVSECKTLLLYDKHLL